jgi:hypothetical protein
MRNTNPNETTPNATAESLAADACARRMTTTKNLLSLVTRMIDEMERKHASAGPNWTDAQILRIVNDKLAYICADLGNASHIGTTEA